jgi:hypothetical protein
MTHRKDKAEEQAIVLLKQVLNLSEADRGALPDSAVKHVKLAIAIMRKRRRKEGPAAPHPHASDAWLEAAMSPHFPGPDRNHC